MAAVTESKTFITEPKVAADELNEEDVGGLENLVSGVTQTSQSTLLLKKRKEMREVDDALAFMKEEFKARMKECAIGHEKYKKKQLEMKEMVTRFAKLIEDNDAKRSRAMAKALAETAATERAEAQIKELKEELKKANADKERMQARLDKLVRYKNYLDDVVFYSGEEYDDIEDLLKRHQVLSNAHADLNVESMSHKEKIEALRSKLSTMRREAQNSIFLMSSQTQERQKEIEKLREEVAQLEVGRETEDDRERDKNLEWGQVEMSIRNLYQRCVSSQRRRLEKDPKGSKEEYLTACLKAVEERMLDLIDIRKDYSGYLDEKEAALAAKAKERREAAVTSGRPPTPPSAKKGSTMRSTAKSGRNPRASVASSGSIMHSTSGTGLASGRSRGGLSGSDSMASTRGGGGGGSGGGFS